MQLTSIRKLGDTWSVGSKPALPVLLPSWVQIVCWTTSLIVLTLLSLRVYNSYQVGVYRDDASYVILAESIIRGPSYGLIYHPTEPISTQFPFGFPLILSALTQLPNELQAMKSVSLLATLVNIGLVFWSWPILTRNQPYWLAIATTALIASSPMVVDHTRMIMSESIFTTLYLVALILAEKTVADRKSLQWPLLLGLTLCFSAFVRTAGLALSFGIVLVLIAKLKLSVWVPLSLAIASAILLTSAVLVLTPISVHDMWPRKYVDEVNVPVLSGENTSETNMVGRAWFGAKTAAFHIRGLLIPVGGGDSEKNLGERFGIENLPTITSLLTMIVVMLGALTLVLSGSLSPFLVVSILVYTGLLLMWPWDDRRFLYPVQPVLILSLLTGFHAILTRLIRFVSPTKTLLIGSRGIVVTVIALLFMLSVTKSLALPNTRTTVGDVTLGATWLRDNTPGDAIVATRHPEVVYIYSTRKTVHYPEVKSVSALRQFITDNQIDYLLIEPKLEWSANGSRAYDDYTEQFLFPLLDELVLSRDLALVYTSPQQEMVKVFCVTTNECATQDVLLER
jgi:hypothetical protein